MAEWKEYIYRVRVTEDIVDEAEMSELVRCEDCIYKQGRECTRFADILINDDDYCSRGAKMDEVTYDSD